MSEAYIDAQSAKDFCAKIYENGASKERLILILRILGFSQVVSVFILSKSCNIEHYEAKSAVIESNTWSENYEANIQMQKDIAEYLDSIE